jgi:gliding motility-associated-like protein
VAIAGHCTDTLRQVIKVLKTAIGKFAIPDTAICYGDGVKLGTEDTTVEFKYSWSPGTWLDNPNIANPTSTPHADITYVVLKSFEACVSSDTVRVRVRHPKIDFNYQVVHNCAENVISFENTSRDADGHFWYINDTLASTDQSPVFTFPYGTQVKGYLLISDHGACPIRKEFDITLPSADKLGIFIPNVITPNGDGANDCFKVVGFKNLDMTCRPESLEIFNRWGERVHSNPESCWGGLDERTGNKLTTGVYYYILRFENKEYKGTVTVIW